MIFDKMCKIIERELPQLRPILEDAKIFLFEGAAHKILPTEYSIQRENEFFSDFFLPYRTIAIEDLASCVVLHDFEEGQMGLDCPRRFIELLPRKSNKEGYEEYTDDELPHDCILGGVITKIVRPGVGTGRISWQYAGYVDLIIVQKDKKCIVEVARDKNGLTQFMKKESEWGRNTIAAIEEVFYFNHPDKFVFETRNKNLKIKKNPKKILRSNQRPIYTILDVKSIQNIMGSMGSMGGKRKSPIEHPRRRTIRYLSAPRYSSDISGNPLVPYPIPSGKRMGELHYRSVVVRNAWIGHEQAVVGNKVYRVRHDL